MRSIAITRTEILDDQTINLFVKSMRDYIVACGEIRHALRNISGCVFDTTDYIAYFMNDCSEDLIFRQRRGEDTATLLHSDWNWDPVEITPDALTKGDQYEQLGITTVGQLVEHLNNSELKELAQQIEMDVDLRSFVDQIPVVGTGFIVNKEELAWLRACSAASNWWRSAPT